MLLGGLYCPPSSLCRYPLSCQLERDPVDREIDCVFTPPGTVVKVECFTLIFEL